MTTPPPPVSSFRGTILVFFSYLLLSIAWSWPLARLDPTVFVTRNFDIYPTVWLVSQAPESFPSLVHASSAWPVGESLARVDSYVLLTLGWLAGNLLDPRTLVALIALLGPPISALAAERCAARAFDVPRPASWVAGVMYGFGGCTAAALLEGHVYHVFDPWLPLLLWAAWKANSAEGTIWHGVAAAAAWAAALATTAYAGVLGAVLLALVIARGGLARLLPGLFCIALPAGLLYTELFRLGDRWADGRAAEPSQILRMGSATLAGMAGWGDVLDLRGHSIGAPVGFTGFALFLLAPVVLRRRQGWRTLFALAALGLFTALGRSIRIEPGSDAWWSPVAWLVNVPGIAFFRFPVRATWLYTLCGSMVAARVTAAIGERVRPALLAPVFVLMAAGALISTGLPWRLHAQIATAPSAYAAAPLASETGTPLAVLDLWPPVFDKSSGELEMWTRVLTCFYQSQHKRPIFEVCIGTSVDSPREILDRWLSIELLRPAPDRPAIAAQLGALGVGAVVLHEDLYRTGDREALVASLDAQLGPAAATSDDGGEHIRLWTVPALPGADPRAAWEAFHGARQVLSSGP